MKELLYIETSPRKTRSASTEVAQAFIGEVLRNHPGCRVTTLNPWTMDLPELSQDMLDAKYAGINGVPLTAPQQFAWDQVKQTAAPFHVADHIVLAAPLWNFGVPYKLKHLIDVVSHKDVLFRFDAAGLIGMLQTQAATVICARGLDYPLGEDGSAHDLDFQRPYIETWLRFIGVRDVRSIVVEKTLLGPEIDAGARDEARRSAVEHARSL
ncbi:MULTISPECIES: FMN-dependent NADH-azoreductase [unclassified Variovorax]|uniref:FMN-dependent NADH-azoreductase n=1 Tax=unclassified Variovorax TaxID=663243 RepID=UPI000888CF19|nr:NAD(P)H-dependent oxidoreductase [Variovorax sp. CF079]SDE52092.1 FMN-dependent NADH-azoreductase [Variovorax sp. CF079]